MDALSGRVSHRLSVERNLTLLKQAGNLLPAGTFVDGLSSATTSTVITKSTEGVPYRQLAVGEEIYFNLPVPLTSGVIQANLLEAILLNDSGADNSIQLQLIGKLWADTTVDYDTVLDTVLTDDTVAYCAFALNSLQYGMFSGTVKLVSATAPVKYLGTYLGW